MPRIQCISFSRPHCIAAFKIPSSVFRETYVKMYEFASTIYTEQFSMLKILLKVEKVEYFKF
jgi:hypothetical protein